MNRSGDDGANARRPAGMLDDQVLAVMWTDGRPMSPAEVATRPRRPLAYTTVMSTLTRLYRKGLVTRESTGRGYTYTPTMDEPAHIAVSVE